MTTETMQAIQTSKDCYACGDAAFEEYVAMADEFDALMTAIQAQRHSKMEGSDSDNPFYCVDDHTPGWDRIALLARVLGRQAGAIREHWESLAR